MAGFADVLGHEQTIAHMKKAIELGKVSHAYIINGEKGSGKKLARAAEELYDLAQDPSEKQNLIRSRADVADELRAMLKDTRDAGRSRME